VDEICESIVQTGLHADMLTNLGREALSAGALNDPKSGATRDFTEAHIATLYNVVRKTQSARAAFRQCRALHILHKFRDCTEFPVISILAYFQPTLVHRPIPSVLSHCYCIVGS